uniref:Receptor L-domain domain-containing protein n=1 Tax=Panagrolaimus davidi TaxID=227884 RepID=A0A914PHF6_9BILA
MKFLPIYFSVKQPVVCTGTKPLIIHENYSNILATDADKKEYYEQYWYQIYNHLHGCEIIAGNLIIPHQHDVPFETKRLNEAIEKIEIVTGFIYIYDVGLDLDFKNLKMVYGNDLFKYPSTWERDANSGEDYNVAFNKEYAIFVERFTAEHLLMPQLRYIKRGNIGFKNVDKLCVWHPELQLLDFDEMFDDSFKQRVIKLDDKSFTNCDGISRDCVAAGRPKIGNIPAQICTKCFKNEEGYCQPSTKQFCPNDCLKKPNLSPTFCEVITPINLFCCPQHSHGGCSLVGEESSAFHCEKGYYLQIDTANLAAPRKCLDFCNGKVINGTDICLTRDGVSNADEEIECPDYMFTFDGGRKCSHHCPYGSEMDPIGNVVGDIDGIKDQARRDDLYKKYWPYHRKCKPCRMIYKTEDKDFVDDCGVHCVIQSNSLSFVTILNVYPAATDMKYYDLQTFTAIFTTGDHKNITDASSEIFKKQCRHIFGSLHIDQYSVGYPSNAKRLIAEHFRILTYATGLYGTIRIENTEGYWFAEPFRNLLAIDKPIPGKIALDQNIDNSVTVRRDFGPI